MSYFNPIVARSLILSLPSAEDPNETTTCQVMGQIAQFINVYVANITHRPFHCHTVHNSYCNNITCTDPYSPGSAVDMSFLPCGDKIGYHTAYGNDTVKLYNFTIYKTTMAQYSRGTFGNITLEQSGDGEVTFQVCVRAL